MNTLPYDFSRCFGYVADGDLREGCDDCLRRTAPGDPERQVYIEPPPIVVFECESRIPPGEA